MVTSDDENKSLTKSNNQSVNQQIIDFKVSPINANLHCRVKDQSSFN